ncbi:MAG: hypothetical protein ACYC5Z_09235 [Acidimicrobiales bacterium]
MARVVTPPRVLIVLVVLVALVAAIVVLSAGSGPATSCVGRASNSPGLSAVSLVPVAGSPGSLTPATGSTSLTPGEGSTSFTTLPPSRDNDAGRSRIPDATPDADNDTSRSRVVCATN